MRLIRGDTLVFTVNPYVVRVDGRVRASPMRASTLGGNLKSTLLGIGFQSIVDQFRLVSAAEEGEATKPVFPFRPDAQGERFGLRPLLKRGATHALGLFRGRGLPFPGHRVISNESGSRHELDSHARGLYPRTHNITTSIVPPKRLRAMTLQHRKNFAQVLTGLVTVLQYVCDRDDRHPRNEKGSEGVQPPTEPEASLMERPAR
jgi:hypothetical protein